MLSIRVLIASHIRLYRDELARVLREPPQFTLVGNAGSATEVPEQIRKLGADVVLLDMAMSGALSVAKEVAGGSPSKVVALGMQENETEVLGCAEVGIAGYVTRDGSVADVVAAINAAARGEVCCAPQTATSRSRRRAAMHAERLLRSGNGALTVRETQILKLVQERLSNREIALTLGIELSTVKNHVHSVLLKLGIRRRTEAISLLYRSHRERAVAHS